MFTITADWARRLMEFDSDEYDFVERVNDAFKAIRRAANDGKREVRVNAFGTSSWNGDHRNNKRFIDIMRKHGFCIRRTCEGASFYYHIEW